MLSINPIPNEQSFKTKKELRTTAAYLFKCVSYTLLLAVRTYYFNKNMFVVQAVHRNDRVLQLLRTPPDISMSAILDGLTMTYRSAAPQPRTPKNTLLATLTTRGERATQVQSHN